MREEIIGDAQQELFQSLAVEKRPSSHVARIKHILEVYSSRGLTLKTLADERHLRLSEKKLQKYARKAGVKFSDYIPRSMRPKKEKKARKNASPAV